MPRKYTDAQKRATLKYLQDKTDDIRLRLPKGTKERWRAAAEARGKSMTQMVAELVEAELRKMG